MRPETRTSHGRSNSRVKSEQTPRLTPPWVQPAAVPVVAATAPLQLLSSGELARRALATRIKTEAQAVGLSVSAITTADPLAGLDPMLQSHIGAGHISGLDWFTPERASFSTDPRNLLPTAQSIVAVGIAYWPGETVKPNDGTPRGRIARYAWGGDYHSLLKHRMRAFHERIEHIAGEQIEARFLVDTARIVDRAVASRSGLGWYGKNACLIVPGYGSWVLLGVLLLDLDVEPDRPLNHDCGRCQICLTRCPTGAIVAPYTVSTPRCLSFQTIEQRGAIPRELRPLLGDWVFGCDVCQEVCPYTGAAETMDDVELRPRSIDNAFPSLHRLLRLSAAEFQVLYRGTAVTRAKRRGLARNAAVALGNIGSEADVALLATVLAEHDEPVVREHAAWALGSIGGPRSRAALDRHRRLEPASDVLREIELTLATVS